MKTKESQDNQQITAPIHTQVHPELDLVDLELSCEACYQTNYKTFGEMFSTEVPFIAKINDGLILSAKVKNFLGEILENLKSSTALIKESEEKNFFNNKAFILHIKIILLIAEFYSVIEQTNLAFDCYYDAFLLIKKHIKQLNFEKDPLFQQLAIHNFERFQRISTVDPEFRKILAEIKKEVELFKPEFLDKCGDSIVKLSHVYDDCVEAFVYKRNQGTTDARETFFALARSVKAACEKMKIDGQLPLHYQLYVMETNYYMINISELTHLRSVWHSIYVNKQINFVVNPTTVSAESLKSYLSFWSGLKKLYIEPTIEIVKNINLGPLLSDIHLFRYFQPLLLDWLYLLIMPNDFFRHWADVYLKPKKGAEKHLFTTLPKGTAATILTLEAEIEFLISAIGLIADVNKGCNKILAMNGLKTDETILHQVTKSTLKIKELKARINSLKFTIKKQNEKEIKLANIAAAEMARVEDQKKALRDEKLRQKQLIIQEKKKEAVQQAQQESESEDDPELEAPLAIVHKSVLDLQDIDVESLRLARLLKKKTDDSFEIMLNRANKEIAIPAKEQGQAFQEISEVVIGYYDLVSLYEKHKELSQKPEVQCQENIQTGIKVSQIELQKTSRLIHGNIEAILSLIDKLIALGKEGKNKTIYSMGKNYVENHKEEEQSEANILKQGKRLFREIGEKKKRNNQEFSEYSQQREFLETMKLTFSGLGYLQLKLKPYLFENYNEALNNNSHFNSGNSKKKAGITYGRFQGMMGLVFKGQYEQSNDSKFLREAIEHFTQAFNFFKKTNHKEALCEVSYHLGSTKDLLAQKNQDKALKQEALKHYQDALTFNDSASKKLDLDRREKILHCISIIEQEVDPTSQVQCHLQG